MYRALGDAWWRSCDNVTIGFSRYEAGNSDLQREAAASGCAFPTQTLRKLAAHDFVVDGKGQTLRNFGREYGPHKATFRDFVVSLWKQCLRNDPDECHKMLAACPEDYRIFGTGFARISLGNKLPTRGHTDFWNHAGEGTQTPNDTLMPNTHPPSPCRPFGSYRIVLCRPVMVGGRAAGRASNPCLVRLYGGHHCPRGRVRPLLFGRRELRAPRLLCTLPTP